MYASTTVTKSESLSFAFPSPNGAVRDASAGSWGGEWISLYHQMFTITHPFRAPRNGDASDPFTNRDIVQC
eukprot:10227261-Karenia_brevis.AAC.1